MKGHFNTKANAKEGTDRQKLKNIETDCDTGWAFEILLGWTVFKAKKLMSFGGIGNF